MAVRARLQAFQRVSVLLGARELIGLGRRLGVDAHEAPASALVAVVGVLETVEEHVVLHLGVAEARAWRIFGTR